MKDTNKSDLGREMIKFRDELAKDLGLDLLVYTNQDGVKVTEILKQLTDIINAMKAVRAMVEELGIKKNRITVTKKDNGFFDVEAQPSTKTTKGSIIPAHVKRYGSKQHNGGELAVYLEGKSVEEIKSEARDVGVDTARYEHQNNGQQRMNVRKRIQELMDIGVVILDEDGLRRVTKTDDGSYDVEVHPVTDGKNQDCNDDLAQFLRGKSIDEIKAEANKVGIDPARWEHLNNGQQSMCIRNEIRQRMLKGIVTLDENGLHRTQ